MLSRYPIMCASQHFTAKQASTQASRPQAYKQAHDKHNAEYGQASRYLQRHVDKLHRHFSWQAWSHPLAARQSSMLSALSTGKEQAHLD
jgi:hypothetical protein